MKFFGSAVCKNNLLRQTKAVAKTYSSYLFPKTFLLSHPTSRIFPVSRKALLGTFGKDKSTSAKLSRVKVLFNINSMALIYYFCLIKLLCSTDARAASSLKRPQCGMKRGEDGAAVKVHRRSKP